MKLLALVITLSLMGIYVNCGSPGAEVANAPSVVLGDPNNVNNWKEPVPAVICGKGGYELILRNYVRPHCAACHMSGGLAYPYFADTNLDTAHFNALLVPRVRWIETTTHNQFCGPTCNLTPGGQIHSGLMQWLDYPTACP